MTDVQVNIPGNKSSLLANNHAIATMYALNDPAVHKKDYIRYTTMRKLGNDELLAMWPITGDIMFTSNFLDDTTRNITDIDIGVYAQDSYGEDKTTFQVNVSPPDILNCDLITNDLCYWQSATYRVYENRIATPIGTLSSPYLAEMCKGYNISYEITKGQSHFVLTPSPLWNKTWNIQTIQPLNRDVLRVSPIDQPPYGMGQRITVGVTCYVTNPQGTERTISKNITVNVLDEDDNPLVSQENDTIHVPVNKGLMINGTSLDLASHHLIFVDADSPDVNNYNIRLLNDTANILKPNCSIYPDTRDGEHQTVVFCKLYYTKNGKLPDSPYRVVLEINDTTLLNGHGNSVIRQPIELKLLAKKQKIQQKLQLPSTSLKDNLPPLILYPSRETLIFITAAPYARVIQPDPRNHDNATNFYIRDSTGNINSTLAITRKEGIVYVNNSAPLRKMKLSGTIILTIAWKRNGVNESDEVHIKIINETSCLNFTSEPNHWNHCAEFGIKSKCERECGLSTGGAPNVKRRYRSYYSNSRCEWKAESNENSYASCTPDAKTCPDKVCDSLEQKHELICPQDCTTKIGFGATPNKVTNLGLGDARDVCICGRSANCFCQLKETKSAPTPIPNSTIYNITPVIPPLVGKHTANEIITCGTTCMLGIAAGIVFLLGAVAVVVACWRLDRVQKAVRGKFTEDAQDLSAPLSDYVDRGILPDTLHLNFDMITMLNNQENKLAPDPKWEFPRNQLIIEQTLGEGEFGRVLRARAKDIAGHSGYTTVAVKTLKEDARHGELNDLLSEYELLKEVSHPNVIRLLGASTIPGGPVYLIIEFAQYGSLRSYLRRSRHLKSESHVPLTCPEDCDPHQNYDQPNTSKVTPKDILSFAWQISNGMSYLSEVKLVHRDLAARNVLVAANKICKISDFGLTRDIYEDNAYFKRSKGRVPVKWMAPESLSDHLYTIKSDVWSFGILIWELVTLGATPYPGVPVQNLFHLLKQGYRMERPENCSPTLYKVMRGCWHIDPQERLEFSDLALKFEKMLSDGVEYLDLQTNIIHNRSYFCMNFDEEENDVIHTTNNNKESLTSINYLEKLHPYIKCGDSEKIFSPTFKSEEEPLTKETTQGYESPIKIPNKMDRPKTPTNESPQYYTDMAQQNKTKIVQ